MRAPGSRVIYVTTYHISILYYSDWTTTYKWVDTTEIRSDVTAQCLLMSVLYLDTVL